MELPLDYFELNIMLDKGLTQLAAYTLVEAGAIDSNHCFEWAKPTEVEIEELVKTYTRTQIDEDDKEFWKNVTCWVNAENEHYFIDSESHFITEKELKEWGFKKV